MFDLSAFAVIAGVFLLAGAVKGVIGLGLPTVSLGLLTVVRDLPTAMALLLIPSLVTNFWQALAGGNALAIAARLWPFLLMATVTVWLGAMALSRVHLELLSGLLGGLLIAYSVLNLTAVRATIALRHERLSGVFFGMANGVLTGMTGSFVVPGVMFLQAIGLPRDMLIQAMGMLFTVSTLALALALESHGFLNQQSGLASAAAVLPAALGMLAGQHVRQRLSENRFRQLFLIAILLLGIWIMVKSAAQYAGVY